LNNKTPKDLLNEKQSKDNSNDLIELVNETMSRNNKKEDVARFSVNAGIREYINRTKPLEDFSRELRRARLDNSTSYERSNAKGNNLHDHSIKPVNQYTTPQLSNKLTPNGNRSNQNCSVENPIMNIDVILDNAKERITLHYDDTVDTLAESFVLKHRKVCE